MDERQFCTFYLDRLFFGIEVTKVQEVIKFHEITTVPLSKKVIKGLINLRGQIVTAVDLRTRLELSERQDLSYVMNIIIKIDDGAVSFMVDEIGDVLEIGNEYFEHPPETLKGIARELICGAYKLKDRLLLILDTEKVLSI